MNCWFCNAHLANELHCSQPVCREAQVVHFYYNILEVPLRLYKAGFTAKIKERTFFVDYIVNPRPQQQTKCQIKDIYTDKESGGCGFRVLLTLPYPPIILTPANYQTRLPTYLTFS